ncbi:MAG TPA: hypothetical protein VNM72_12980 [Blastocatellia bacterium]|nr:hypothetical protein [Blastocatellia bacterium]
MIFRTASIAAAHGGTPIIDFAVRYKGQSLTQALDNWHQKANGKPAIDYSFHLIVTDLPAERLPELKRLIHQEGVTSFKLFRAYPGVFLVDDGTIFKAMTTAAETSRDKDEPPMAELDLDMTREVRHVWKFFGDRRPETYNELGKI